MLLQSLAFIFHNSFFHCYSLQLFPHVLAHWFCFLGSHSSFTTPNTLFSLLQRKQVICCMKRFVIGFGATAIVSPPFRKVNVLWTPALVCCHSLWCLWLMRGSHFICWTYQCFCLVIIAWPAMIVVCSIYWLRSFHPLYLCLFLSVEAHWHFILSVPTCRLLSKSSHILMMCTLRSEVFV